MITLVRAASSERRARPKSMILTWPVGRMWMLPGLRSRCTTPLAWAKARPSQICSMIPSFSGTLVRARFSISSRRSVPSRSSIAMKMIPCSSPKSKTVMMFGWLRAAADCASRWKRWRATSSLLIPFEIVLMATKRPRTGSWALYTSPIAPWPILPRSLYLPICSKLTLSSGSTTLSLLASPRSRATRTAIVPRGHAHGSFPGADLDCPRARRSWRTHEPPQREGRPRSPRRPPPRLPAHPRRTLPHPERLCRGVPARRGPALRPWRGRGPARGRGRERPGPRDPGRSSLRVRRLAEKAGSADHPPLRPPRRAARGTAREVGLAPLRAHRAQRAALRTRHRRRQGGGDGPRGRGGLLPQVHGGGSLQRQVHHRGGGGDRLREPRALPRKVQGPDGGGLHRAVGHRELRHRHPRPHLPAPRHLPGGRGGAGAGPAPPQRHVGRARPRPRADPLRADRGPPGQERRAEHPRSLPEGGEDPGPAASAHPQASLQRGQVQARGGDDAGDEAGGREGLLGLREALDAAIPHRDRFRSPPHPGLFEPDHRRGAGSPFVAHGPQHGREGGGPPAGQEAHREAPLRGQGGAEEVGPFRIERWSDLHLALGAISCPAESKTDLDLNRGLLSGRVGGSPDRGWQGGQDDPRGGGATETGSKPPGSNAGRGPDDRGEGRDRAFGPEVGCRPLRRARPLGW